MTLLSPKVWAVDAHAHVAETGVTKVVRLFLRGPDGHPISVLLTPNTARDVASALCVAAEGEAIPA